MEAQVSGLVTTVSKFAPGNTRFSGQWISNSASGNIGFSGLWISNSVILPLEAFGFSGQWISNSVSLPLKTFYPNNSGTVDIKLQA